MFCSKIFESLSKIKGKIAVVQSIGIEALIGFVLLLRYFDLFGICDIRGNIGSTVYIRTKAKYVNHLSSSQSPARKQLS